MEPSLEQLPEGPQEPMLPEPKKNPGKTVEETPVETEEVIENPVQETAVGAPGVDDEKVAAPTEETEEPAEQTPGEASTAANTEANQTAEKKPSILEKFFGLFKKQEDK